MSLATIQTAVWDLLLQEATSPTSADNVTLLAALNAARQDAERKHDWVASKRIAYLRVTATTGSLLSSATAGYTVGSGPSGSAVLIKGIRKARRFNSTNSSWSPAHVMTYDKYEALLTKSNRSMPVNILQPETAEWSTTVGTENFPSTKALLLQDGLRCYVNETTDQDFKLWVYEWQAAYASFAATDDFFTLYASDYLMWAAIEWLNFKKGAFLPRKEGSITPEYVTKMKDAAWDSLIVWDAWLQQQDDTYILSD